MTLRVLIVSVLAAVALAAPGISQDAPDAGFVESVERAKSSMMGDPAAALEAAEAAEAVAAGSEQQATALWLQGEALTRMNRAKTARPLIDRAIGLLDMTGASSKLAGDLAIAKGRAAKDVGDVQTSLVAYQQAFEVFHALDDARGQAKALQYLGGLYIEAHQYDRALDYFRQADDAFDADPSLALASANSQANALRETDRNDEAIALFNEALRVSESFNSPVLRARILTNRAASEVRAGQLDAAKASTDEAMSLIEGAGADDWTPFIWGVKAEAAFAASDLAAAADYIARTFEGRALDATVAPFRDFHRAAYQIYAARGEVGLALAHHEAFKRLDDEGRALAASASAALLGAEFDFATQRFEIERLKTEQLERDVALAAAKTRQRTLIFSGAFVMFVGVTVSLSAAYLSIRRSRNRVSAANAELAVANVALEQANRAKSDFLAMTSHEVRTPLNAIIGLTDVLLKSRSHDAETLDYLQSIRSAGGSMVAIVDDLLDVAKIETNGLTIATGPTNAATIIVDVMTLMRPAAEAKGLTLTADAGDGLDDLITDAKRFRQILFNLLSNAVKFTDAGSIRLVAAIEADGETRELVVRVSDTGLGVPAEQLDRIFESFHQVDGSTTRRHGGVGLGLAICRNIARALGGDISVESRLGEGSTFTVRIAAPSANDERGGDPEGVAETRPVCIVFLSNPIEAAIVRSIADGAGFVVDLRAPQDLAAAAEHATRADLVIADAASLESVSEPFPADFGVVIALAGADAACAPRAGVEFIHRPIAPTAFVELFAKFKTSLREAA